MKTISRTVQQQIEIGNKHIEQYLSKHESLLGKFNCLRKYLDIVLDEELIKMVMDNSVVRQLTNNFAYPPAATNEDISDNSTSTDEPFHLVP